MKLNKIRIYSLIMATLLTGCSQYEIPDDEINSSSANDSMQPLVSDTSLDQTITTTTHIKYGFGFTEESIEIENGRLTLTPSIIGDSASTNLGLLVFIDGIPIKYTDRNSDTRTFMANYDTVPNEETFITLDAEAAVDVSLDEHYIAVCTMLCPNFYPNVDKPHFGNYHSLLGMQEKLSIEGLNYIPADDLKITKIENTMLTDEHKKWLYRFCSGDGDVDNEKNNFNAFELEQIGNDRNNSKFFLAENESSVKLKFSACSSEPYVVDIRVSFYVNHEQVKFNGDMEYLDYTKEGRKFSEAEITIDNVKVGDVIYCIGIPLNGEDMHLKNTASYIVLGENDKILPNDNKAKQ